MRKVFLFISLIIIVFYACEKDDFCLENPVTPNLVLRFYDVDNRETVKSVDSLYIWAEGKDTIFENVSTDSIYIPLNSLSTETVYNFSSESIINQFTIEYTTEEEYVSRSCGYKVIFNDVSFSSDNTWITDFTPGNLTVLDNQDEAHVKIYH